MTHRPLLIAAAWTGIAAAGALLTAVRLWTLGRLELFPQHVLGAVFFIPLWAIATEVVFRAVARHRIDGPRRAAWYALGGGAFFVLSNALVRIPFLFTRGVDVYRRDLLLGLSEFAPAAMLAFAVIVVIAHKGLSVVGDQLSVDAQRSLAHDHARHIDRQGTTDHRQPSTFLHVNDRGVTHLIPFADIVWLEAEDNYVLIHTPARTFTARQKISELEARLGDEPFIRVHRSAIVRIDTIRAVRQLGRGDFEVVLCDGTAVRGARSRRASVLALLSGLPGYPVARLQG